MKDIHCHILPGVDDGADCMEEAIEMAKMAYDSGVTDIIATPHFRGETESLEQLEEIRAVFERLQAALALEVPGLKLHLGAEVLCLPQTEELADAHQLPTLADTNYVLTEFYFDETFAFMDSALEQIAKNGYRIVVAHPERYMVFHRRPELLEKWADKGYVLQMNKGSVLGLFGSRVQQSAREILGRGVVHLVASDGHSCTHRTPHMGKIDSWAQRYCTAAYAKMLLTDNPGHILRNEPVEQL